MNTPPPLPGKKKRSLALPIIVAVAILGAVLTWLELKPQWEEARARVTEKAHLSAVRNNLVLIGVTADTYFAQEPSKDRVTVAELRQWFSGTLPLRPVEAEDYGSMVITRGWSTLAISLPTGARVEYTKK